MDARKYDEVYTIEDIYDLPEGERAELIDGQLYMMAAPGLDHQDILGLMFRKMSDCIESHQKDCKVIIAPFAVYLKEDNSIYVEPDLMVVCDRSKIEKNGVHGAPDFIAEIVSPSSKSMDHIKKMIKYREAGVKEYWIVDPIDKRVYVYDFNKDETESFPFGESVSSRLCADFTMNFKEFR
ncbi:MAG: Uma2 family endonuclease [Lachnospiraceae bacterium]|nr:Uma2 family endonuclease [Lachnospiraceae bacterium]MBP3296202.1 Uma2 family endonuclease [Lachnospiraceae bacterium]